MNESLIKKRILYFTFYFHPDLSAGSFRNTSLINELSSVIDDDTLLTVVTTMPNRYSSYKEKAKEYEEQGNLKIYRINVPPHKSGMGDQMKSFGVYFIKALFLLKGQKFDLIVSSSSRFFTSFLGYLYSRKVKAFLFLDIRDLFLDTIKEVLPASYFKPFVIKFLSWLEHIVFSKANHINLISEGFKPYFINYNNANYSFYSNGIDDDFINNSIPKVSKNDKLLVVYAGNIGEGQGLHKIIPGLADALVDEYEFLVIGDGGAKIKLILEIQKLNLCNVTLLDPVNRNQLITYYNKADFLFLHLNDYEAFKKVLPSKIFELASFNKPIIAGVGGFSKKFIEENITNCILFNPCSINEAVQKIRKYNYKLEKRDLFIKKFNRKQINKEMASTILSYLPTKKVIEEFKN